MEITVEASDLLRWAQSEAERPERVAAAVANALNVVGDGVVTEVVNYIAGTTGIDADDIRRKIQISEATADNPTFEMDASLIAPPSMDWSRPWATRDDQTMSAFDQQTLVNIVTMGDQFVCQICEDAAEASPYTLEDAQKLQQTITGVGYLHPNCRCLCPGTIVEGEIIGASKSWYSGPIVELITAGGRRLRLTINHPVLTTHGMIAAGSLRKGMQLVCKRRNISLPSTTFDVDCKPSVIEDVFNTLATFGLVKTKISSFDFHGDARYIDGEIDVVFSDRRLLRDFVSNCLHTSRKGGFVVSDVSQFSVSRDCSFSSFTIGNEASSSSIMCGSDLLKSLSLTHTAPLDTFLVGRRAEFDFISDENTINSCSSGSIFSGKSESGCPSFVVDDDLTLLCRSKSTTSDTSIDHPSCQSNFGHTFSSYSGLVRESAQFDSASDKVLLDRYWASTGFSGDSSHADAGSVEFDDVVDLRFSEFIGHVYDLQTVTGYIIAEGVAIGNCVLQTFYAYRQLPVQFSQPAAAAPQNYTVHQLGQAVAKALQDDIKITATNALGEFEYQTQKV